MTGAQLKKVLTGQSDSGLAAMKVVVQQGEGEPREVVGVRTISEQTLDGEGVSELLVLRLNPARRDRGAIGAAKERAERKPPATKDA